MLSLSYLHRPPPPPGRDFETIIKLPNPRKKRVTNVSTGQPILARALAFVLPDRCTPNFFWTMYSLFFVVPDFKAHFLGSTLGVHRPKKLGVHRLGSTKTSHRQVILEEVRRGGGLA